MSRLFQRLKAPNDRTALNLISSARLHNVTTFTANYLGLYSFQFQVNSGSIGQEILSTGSFSLDLMDFAAETIGHRAGLFVNVGANIGTTVVNAYSHGIRDIVAFEPVAENFELLCSNIANLPESENIRPVRQACGAKAENMAISLHPTSAGKHSFSRSNSEVTELVSITRLDDEFDPSTNVSALWIDAEGYEFEVIKGGEKLIKSQRPLLCLEVIPSLLGSEQLTGISEFLSSLNYQVFTMKSKKFDNLLSLAQEINEPQFDVFCVRK